MTVRLPCIRCGAQILEGTAATYAGLCAPCANGTRPQVETGKRRYAEEAERHRNPPPEDLLWRSLVHRVFRTDAGFSGLTSAEQTYYLTNVLSGEVFNGGFDQFFSNSSGNRFQETREALRVLGARSSLALLEDAALLLFGDLDVPSSEAHRHDRLVHRTISDANRERVEALDRKFWQDLDGLDRILAAFAVETQLLPERPPA
jgi:hypothetical protein